MVALQAAEENPGIVLGWHSQVEALIRSGKLVCISDMEIPAPGSFYLSWGESRPLSEAARCLRDWLISVGREFTGPRAGDSALPGESARC